jgi:hypothetical protein
MMWSNFSVERMAAGGTCLRDRALAACPHHSTLRQSLYQKCIGACSSRGDEAQMFAEARAVPGNLSLVTSAATISKHALSCKYASPNRQFSAR